MEKYGRVKAQVWDTAGQEKYRSITAYHYKKAHGALVLYDVTSKESFNEVRRWVEEIRKNCQDCQITLVGNKIDLARKSSRMVNSQEGTDLAEELGLRYCETSAKTGDNVSRAFVDLLSGLCAYKAVVQGDKTYKSDDGGSTVRENRLSIGKGRHKIKEKCACL